MANTYALLAVTRLMNYLEQLDTEADEKLAVKSGYNTKMYWDAAKHDEGKMLKRVTKRIREILSEAN